MSNLGYISLFQFQGFIVFFYCRVWESTDSCISHLNFTVALMKHGTATIKRITNSEACMPFPSLHIKQCKQLKAFLETTHTRISFHSLNIFKPGLIYIVPFISLLQSTMYRTSLVKTTSGLTSYPLSFPRSPPDQGDLGFTPQLSTLCSLPF